MQAGELFSDVLETEYAWLGATGASPSVKFVDGTPVAWNPLSGVDREVDRFWRQDTPPPPGIHYAWLGERYASESVMLDTDGNETARNLSIDSRATSSRYWQPGTGTSTTRQVIPPVAHPLGIETSCETADTRGSNYLSRVYYFGTSSYPDGGVYIGLWILVPPGYQIEPHGGFPAVELPANEWVFVKTTEKVTGEALGIRIRTIDGSNAEPEHRGYLTGAIVSDTPIDHFFDGSTRSDRANDLWYNAEGVPHEWVNGQGWVEADDRLTPVPDGFMHLPIDTSFTGDTPDVYRVHDDSVSPFTSRILVNGVQRHAEAWSVERELTGHLPAQVVHGAGLIQATGKIDWAPTAEVSKYAANPWNRHIDWVPEHGDRVEIYAGDGQTEWKQFHGVVDKTTGSVGEGFSSTIVDDVDRFSARVSHLPMLRFMPPSTPGGLHRGVGLTSSYYVNFALRQAGFFSTPRNEPGAVLSVPAQGSMWPDQGLVGGLVDGLGKETGYIHAQNFPAPWGWSVGNLSYTYRPRNQNRVTTPVQLTVMVAPNHAGNFTMNAHYGSVTIGLAIWGERYPAAYVNGNRVAFIPSAEFADATIVTMLYKNGTVTLRADNGASATGNASASSSTPMERIELDGDTATRVAGMQVSHPSSPAQEFSSLSFEPSATLDMRNAQFMDLMDAGPRIENQRIRELLNEISESTLSAMWIDETGVMRWVPSPTLRSQPVSQTLTTKNDLLSLRWEDNLLGARSMVTVKGRNCAISRSQWNSVLLYEASSRTMDSGSLLEDFVGPGSDEEWVLPDESMAVLDETSWGSYNSGRGTYGGAHFTRDNDEVPSGSASVTISMERLGINRYKITHQASDFSTNLKAHLATSQVAPVLWDANRSRPLPVVRGMGRVDWIDVESTPITVGGPGPELVHDAGMWNNRQTNLEPLESMASYIAAHTSVPEPTIQGMGVLFDPRRQLADVVNIRSDDYMGVTLRVLITGISTRFNGELYEQSINGQVISVTTSAASFQEWEQAHPNTLTFSQWQSLQSLNDTWGDFNQNPMKGAVS